MRAPAEPSAPTGTMLNFALMCARPSSLVSLLRRFRTKNRSFVPIENAEAAHAKEKKIMHLSHRKYWTRHALHSRGSVSVNASYGMIRSLTQGLSRWLRISLTKAASPETSLHRNYLLIPIRVGGLPKRTAVPSIQAQFACEEALI